MLFQVGLSEGPKAASSTGHLIHVRQIGYHLHPEASQQYPVTDNRITTCVPRHSVDNNSLQLHCGHLIIVK